jgi:hypothetical protein
MTAWKDNHSAVNHFTTRPTAAAAPAAAALCGGGGALQPPVPHATTSKVSFKFRNRKYHT